jgi:SET domain-containing protein
VEVFISPLLRIAESAGKGRGVFAAAAIPEGQVVECSPVIVMDAAARPLLDKTLLHDYIFEWQPEGRNDCCVALGYLSLYNHSFASNCEYVMDYARQAMSIHTMRAIAAGEELTINYNGDWNDPSPLCFEASSEA